MSANSRHRCQGRSARRTQAKNHLWRPPLRLHRLEDRVTPSILSTFELDGNAQTGVLGTSGSTTTSHDWDQVFADAGSPSGLGSSSFSQGPLSKAIAGDFTTDAVNSAADDIFQGGGSKDTLGIQSGQWLFTGSKPQGKDDITHSFAGAYLDASNAHLILYAGMDRFDNSGDATAGFWFFGGTIGENPNSTVNGGHPFTGKHEDGDILLVSDFTIGGSTSTIKVFRWTGNDATGKLVALNNGNPINGNTFAIVNSAPISVPWAYTNKAGQTQPQAGEFLEEGIDVTALGLAGCFSTFLAETRSSQSPTATLSDFTLGGFQLCNLAATPFSGLSKFDTELNKGDTVTYPLTVKNTGGMPLFIQSVTDTLLGKIVVNHTLQMPGAAGVSPTVTGISSSFNFSQPLAPGASLTINVTRPVQANDPDPTTDTATFVGTDDLAGQADQITASAKNSVNLFQPTATMTETASPTTAQNLGDPITYTFTVSNTSSADSPNLVLSTSNPHTSFTDTLLGNLTADAIAAGGGSLAPGASFTFSETRKIQASDPSPLTDTATVAFGLASNLGSFPNIIHASASASVTLLPNLRITKAVTTGSPSVVHPGDTASFTITVSNAGAGPAVNVVVTDNLPDADKLTWTATSSDFSTSIANGVLTATDASLPAGTSDTVTVSAVIPLDFFGNGGSGTGNGDPLPLDLFELDGNATTGVLGTTGSTTPSHDWDQVFADVQNGTTTSGAISTAFDTDKVNSNQDDIFQGGGSKDTQGIQSGKWLFTSGKPQGKDDITHAYAASYKAANDDQILYAGMDRFDSSGDSTAGFWFFVNPIGENPGVTTNGGHPFTGTHHDGDILLVSDFTIGGSVSTIKVFRWTGDDATGSLVALNSGNPINGSTFAIVNGGPISVPWSYTNKSGQTQPAAGEFLEEGINLTALGLQGCFSSFLAETRSSQSPTATLSDFVLGSFNTCNSPLPNMASVSASNFNNGQPIVSNQVTITVNDGDAMLAPSAGSTTTLNTLTADQLQWAVAQGIAAWRTAGVDDATLSNLARTQLHLANLPGGELGYEAGGEIWIDQSAAGWGWSTGPTPTPGRMDLVSVISHELGHVMGFEHSDAGVMEPALMPGVRLLSEVPLADVGSAARPTASGAGAARGMDVPAAQAASMQFSFSRTESGTAPVAVDARFVPAHGPADAGRAAALDLSTATAVGEDASAPIPVTTPFLGRVEGDTGGLGTAVPGDGAGPPVTPIDFGGVAPAGTLLNWLDEHFADPAPAPAKAEPAVPLATAASDSIPASVAAVAVALGAYGVAPPMDDEQRGSRAGKV
jgi:uncharacterized repeat protein (TIGR01451 family)